MSAATARLIIDCGGRISSALIVTPEGLLVPCSQEVKQVTLRHVSSEIAFDARATQDPDFAWDEALEALTKAGPHQFFQKARRIGLRRAWDADLAADALHLASPLAVLSSPAALADPVAAPALATVGVAMLDALLDPIFAFASARGFAPGAMEVVVALPASVGRHARTALHKVFRRRGFRHAMVVPREIAVAMSLVDTAGTECTVWDTANGALHIHHIAIDRGGDECRFRTLASATVRGLGWSDWLQRIASALRAQGQNAAPATPTLLNRALTAFLSGAPAPAHGQSDAQRLGSPLLNSVLGDAWREEQRRQLESRIDDAVPASDVPVILCGDICGVDAIRRLLLELAHAQEPAPLSAIPVLDRATRGIASATLWQRGDVLRNVVVDPGGTLRLNTFHGEAAEIVAPSRIPAPGESCFVRENIRFCGETESDRPFLLHLVWGADDAPEGNATLCAVRVDRSRARDGGGSLRVAVLLRRSRSGRRIHGTVDVRMPDGGALARSGFVHEFPRFGAMES